MHPRQPIRPVIDALFAEPWRFDLVQALALLERAHPAAVRLGTGIDPELESVQIEHDPTLAFPASDVSGLEAGGEARPVLSQPVIGAAGLGGPLPYAFTETILERSSRRDHAMAAFLGIFNHRLASIFYRIRRSTLPMLEGHPEASVMGEALRALIGIGMSSLCNRLGPVPDRVLMGFAAVLADRRCSAAALETLLSGVFHTPVRLHPFVGRWRPLPAAAHTRLSPAAPEEPRRLGVGAVLGHRVWDQQAGCGLTLSFTELARFRDFLPDGRHFREIAALCRFRLGEAVEVLLELVLAAPAIPGLRLSSRDGSRLGWTSWLSSRPPAAPGRIRLIADHTGDEHPCPI